jgi:hypothetical protein
MTSDMTSKVNLRAAAGAPLLCVCCPRFNDHLYYLLTSDFWGAYGSQMGMGQNGFPWGVHINSPGQAGTAARPRENPAGDWIPFLISRGNF